MRTMVKAAGVAILGLAATGVLGVASAETTTGSGSQTKVVSVEGVASEPLTPNASASGATAAYRSAMASAITDGKGKAQFLAGAASASLGPVQSITEDGGWISCPEGVEYEGGEPDFGSASAGGGVGFAVAPRAAGAPAAKPHVLRRKAVKHRRRHAARAAAVASCGVSANVLLSYTLE